MKTTLSLTLSEQDKKRLKPNVSAKLDSIVRGFTDIETLSKAITSSRTSCLLSHEAMQKLEHLSDRLQQPIPKIVAAMIALTINKSQQGACNAP